MEPARQRDLQGIGEEGDEDMGFDSAFVVMEDRADRQVPFQVLEILTKDSPENRGFFGEGVKVVVEVVVDPQRQIDHFDDLGDDSQCGGGTGARKWRM